jgi:hypothetical protein
MKVPRSRWALIAILFAVNAIAHFIPPERASIGPDNYILLFQLRDVPLRDMWRLCLEDRQRPLLKAVVITMAKATGDDPGAAFVLVYLTSSLLLISCYLILLALLRDHTLAFLSSVLLCILPQTVEIHHTGTFVPANFALILCALSVGCFFRFVNSRDRWLLVLSVLSYLLALLCYEVAFFIPAVCFVYSHLYDKAAKRYTLAHASLVVPYLIYRLYPSMSGQAGVFPTHDVGFFNLRPAVTLFHHYFGLYLARDVLYGAFSLFQLHWQWLFLVALLDGGLLYGLSMLARSVDIARLDRRVLWAGSAPRFSDSFSCRASSSGTGGLRDATWPYRRSEWCCSSCACSQCCAIDGDPRISWWWDAPWP